MTNRKDKTLGIVLGIFALVIVTTVASFAFFTYSRTGETTTTIIAGDVEFSYTEGSEVGLSNEFPVSDSTGAVDPNNEYTFTVKMASTSAANVMNYNVYLVGNNEQTGVKYFTNNQIKFALLKNDVFVAGTNSTTGKKISEIAGFTASSSEGEGIVLKDQEILPGVTDSYKLRIWISDEVDYSNTTNGQDDKTSVGKYNGYKYSLKVKVTAGIGESSLNVQSPTVNNLTMTTTISDPNGLSAYAVTNSPTAPSADSSEWISLTDGTAFNNTKNVIRLSTVTSKTITFMVKKNGTYYLHVKNTLGQTSSKVFTANAAGEKAVTKISTLTDVNDNTVGKRYSLTSAQNYVWFNNELWRIIGVFDTDNGSGNIESRVKIIRVESIGNYSWDSSASDTNSGNGMNIWKESDLMDLLNYGAYYNRTKGTCYNGQNNATTECDFSKIGLTSEAKAMIGNAVWHLGTVDTNNVSPWDIYDLERKGNTWTGQVGLMYPSDYGYSASQQSCTYSSFNTFDQYCKGESWLYKSGVDQWTLTPSTNHYGVFFILGEGNINYLVPAATPKAVLPSVYLNENVKILDGNGTKDKPFVLSN